MKATTLDSKPLRAPALEGITVVEIGGGAAAAITGMFLSDFGATVIEVQAPPAANRPTDVTDRGNLLWHRGKDRHTVAPDEADQRTALVHLIKHADICLLSDGWEELLEPAALDAAARDNTGLITVDMAPFHGNPPWVGAHESHGLLAAHMGLSARQASFDGDPVESLYPHITSVHGAWGAVCVVSALIERQSSGFGQLVGVDGVHGVLVTMLSLLSVDVELTDPPTDIGPFGRHPMYSVFPTKDGTWLASGALGTKFETALLKLQGIEHILKDKRLDGDLSRISRPEVFSWVREQVANAFLTRERADWLDDMHALGIPCGPVDSREAWFDQEQVKAIGMRVELEDPVLGKIAVPGIPVRLHHSPGAVRCLATGPRTPLTCSAMAELGAARAEDNLTARLAPIRRGPLAGLRVLNMGTFVAGPYSGSLLAHLGADVIKVEQTTGDPFRDTGFMYSRGMRSVAVDLTNPDGLKAFRHLVASSDAVTSSLRPGVTDKLCITYEDLRAVREDIITLDLSGFGDCGPLAGTPGVDMVVQASSGMMSAQGGDDAPVVNTLAIIDFTTAVLMCLGVTLSVFDRDRTGSGQKVDVSLAATATYLQGPALVRGPEALEHAGVGGRDFKGASWDARLYATADGWVRIGIPDGETPDLAGLANAGFLVDPQTFESDPGAAFARALAAISTSTALVALGSAGVPAAEARKITQVLRDGQLLRSGLLQVYPSAEGGYYTAPARFADFSRTPMPHQDRTPGPGEHTVAVLSELLPASHIDELLAQGAITDGKPMPQRLGAVYR